MSKDIPTYHTPRSYTYWIQEISPLVVGTYLYCPEKAYHLSKMDHTDFNLLSMSPESKVIKNIICRTYFYQMKHGRKPKWKSLLSWADQEFITVLGINPTKFIESAFLNTSKSILSILNKWYHGYYIVYPDEGWSSERLSNEFIPWLPITFDIGNRLIYKDVLDIVKVDGKIELFDFREEGFNKTNPYLIGQDPMVATRIWAFEHMFGRAVRYYTRFIIRPESIQPVHSDITMGSWRQVREKRLIPSTIRNIHDGAIYPLATSDCSQCVVLDKCSKEEGFDFVTYKRPRSKNKVYS